MRHDDGHDGHEIDAFWFFRALSLCRFARESPVTEIMKNPTVYDVDGTEVVQ